MSRVVILCMVIFIAPMSMILANDKTIQAVVTKTVDAKTSPNPKSLIATRLTEGDNVTILKREGGWYFVDFKKAKGWVKLYYLRYQTNLDHSEQKTGLGALATSTKKGHDNVTLTSGVRGLTEKELEEAKPDFEQLANLDNIRVSKSEVDLFAKKGKLVAKKMKYVKGEK